MRAFAVAALLALCGCQSNFRVYRELPVRGLEFDDVWDACVETARTEFWLDPAQTDAEGRQLTTRWRNDLAPFKQGRRRRAEFLIEDLPEGGGHLVKYCVVRQRNAEMSRPLEPAEEDWKGDGQDDLVEARVDQHLRLRLQEKARKKPSTKPAAASAEPEKK
jgi:hypothetical protein